MNFIELASGCGGLSTGIIKAGFVPLLLNDIDKTCCETLQKNHQNVNIICDSFANINYDSYIDNVDLMCAGVPCQSFSSSGQRKGLDDMRGQLMIKYIDIVMKVKPKVFLIENVKGLLNVDDGRVFKYIIDYINSFKLYNVKYEILNACDYDVPQKRERIFIIGTITNNTNNTVLLFPEPCSYKPILRDVLLDVPASDGANYSTEKIEQFKLIPQGGCWKNLQVELQKKYLGNSYYSTGGKTGILHRLSMDKQSLTLMCSPNQNQTQSCHPIEDRPLTIREYARIQTFPDSYQFAGGITNQYKQIGNAVPVNLAYHVGLSIRNFLNPKPRVPKIKLILKSKNLTEDAC